jgi:two-component system OmpR family response regulator
MSRLFVKRHDRTDLGSTMISDGGIRMKTILFVEDDRTLRENISELLRAEGFRVIAFESDVGVIDEVARELPDLVLLDIGLGADSEGGLMLCSELRRRWLSLPLVFFTSHDQDFDKISGMRIGADDYVTKNESLSYLIVRIKALLRRFAVIRQELDPPPAIRTLGLLTLDMNVLSASWRDCALHLTLTQFWLLHALASNPGQVQDHAELMRAANLRRVEPNTIAAHIKSIRREIKRIDPEFSSIKTERGLGYRWITS